MDTNFPLNLFAFFYRLAIVTRCPGYLEGGVPALANPCLYICENSSQIALQYACRQLGLPVNCIRLVPASTSFGILFICFFDANIISLLCVTINLLFLYVVIT